MIKRYILFAGSAYYPHGGWADFQGSFTTLEEAEDYISIVLSDMGWYDWHHIIDLTTGEKVGSEK